MSKHLLKLTFLISIFICLFLTSAQLRADTFTVTNTNDSGAGSLRQAIADANASATHDEIVFDPPVFNAPQTIVLSSGELVIGGGGNLLIKGSGVGLLTISGNNTSRVMRVSSGLVSVTGLNITGGRAVQGGGIENLRNMSLVNVTLTRNSASVADAAANYFSHGGGIETGPTTANPVIIGNSILADNLAPNATNGFEVLGAFTSSGHNLIENPAGATINGTTTGHITGQEPQLEDLKNNGGFTLTRAPNTGSPVINAGSDTLASNAGLTADQRGACFSRSVGSATEMGAFEIQVSPRLVCHNFDYDGDGRSDISVFRPSSGDWYISRSSNGAFDALNFGLQGDLITPADYDGDGRVDISVFRQGFWYRLNSSDNQFVAVRWGLSGDKPVPGDYDGDGLDDHAIFRQGVWYILQSRDGLRAVPFGLGTDLPLAEDFDGDGRQDLAVFRDGAWYLLQSLDGVRGVQFGLPGDCPLAADFDGDGKADLALFRQGSWYILQSRNGFRATPFGLAADVPVAGDYDNDGLADLAVFRAGEWYIQRSSLGLTGQQFGLSSDVPTESAYLP